MSKTEYLVANKYSIADIASYTWASGAGRVDIDLSEYPGVSAWIERIGKREAVIKGKKVPDDGRTTEQIEAFFGMMKKKMDARDNTDN